MNRAGKKTGFKDILSDHFEKSRMEISRNDTPLISEVREKAFAKFIELGFPTIELERWRNTNLDKTLRHDYVSLFKPSHENVNVDDINSR